MKKRIECKLLDSFWLCVTNSINYFLAPRAVSHAAFFEKNTAIWQCNALLLGADGRFHWKTGGGQFNKLFIYESA
jgi:hypothetical protein